MPTPETRIDTSSTYATNPALVAEIKRDKAIPLTQLVGDTQKTLADLFAEKVNEALAGPEARKVLANGKAGILARAISGNKRFPFTAYVQDDVVVITPQLNILSRTPVLKDISDGFTFVYKDVVKSEDSQAFRMGLTMLFQAAIDTTYRTAGVPGSHTDYILRGC